MKKLNPALLSIILLSVMPFFSFAEEADLVSHMSKLQYFTHKTTLAIDKRNKPLAAFYIHEIEHTLEYIENIDSYDGHAVGELSDTILEPAFEDLEEALKTEPWTVVSDKLDGVITACNKCHKTTDHAFIHIQRAFDNPYMQSFGPASK